MQYVEVASVAISVSFSARQAGQQGSSLHTNFYSDILPMKVQGDTSGWYKPLVKLVPTVLAATVSSYY